MRNESSPSKLGQRLISLRSSTGWSQQVAATKAGISTRALCAYETGKTAPKIDVLEQIAAVYGVTLAELFGDVEAA